MNTRHRGWALLVALCVALCATFLAACGGGDGDGGGATEEGGVTKLTVGVIPIADVAPLYVGMDQGFFDDESLKIQPKLAEGGAAIVPSVVSGDYQIGFSNTTSLLIAASKGLDLKIISQGVQGGEKPTPEDAWDGVLVAKDSDITKPADLEGKTIAVNTLQNVGPLTINKSLEDMGVDYKTVKYTEVPFPDMIGALDAGRVDAVWDVEPFVSQGLAGGDRAILRPYEQTAPNYTVATYFTTADYADANSDVVDRFVTAMNKSLEYSQDHPDEVRAEIPKYTEIPADAAKKIVLPTWRSDLNEATIDQTSDLAAKYGFIDEPVDVSSLIRPQP